MEKWIFKGPGSKRALWLPSSIELSEEAEADIQVAYGIAHRRADAEISGIGHVQEREDGFFVSDIIVPRQVCSGGHTTSLGEFMQVAFDELRNSGRNPLEYNFWWHSHVEARAWFSTIDDDMIEGHLKEVMLNTVHYLLTRGGEALPDETLAGPLLSLVGNVYGDMSARCDFVYRRGGQLSEHMNVIPVIRHLHELPEEKRTALIDARFSRMIPIVREKVSFRERLSDLFHPRSLRILEDYEDDQ